jgi:hypothetical protein
MMNFVDGITPRMFARVLRHDTMQGNSSQKLRQSVGRIHATTDAAASRPKVCFANLQEE